MKTIDALPPKHIFIGFGVVVSTWNRKKQNRVEWLVVGDYEHPFIGSWPRARELYKNIKNNIELYDIRVGGYHAGQGVRLLQSKNITDIRIHPIELNMDMMISSTVCASTD